MQFCSPDISYVFNKASGNTYQIPPSVIFEAVGVYCSVPEDIFSQAGNKWEVYGGINRVQCSRCLSVAFLPQ